MRLHAQTAKIENGFVHLPTEAHWLADFLRELTIFSKARHHDQVDSTFQALAWTKQRTQNTGFQLSRASRLSQPSRLPGSVHVGQRHLRARSGSSGKKPGSGACAILSDPCGRALCATCENEID